MLFIILSKDTLVESYNNVVTNDDFIINLFLNDDVAI